MGGIGILVIDRMIFMPPPHHNLITVVGLVLQKVFFTGSRTRILIPPIPCSCLKRGAMTLL